MNILFIQLPLVDHGYNYIGGNVQYSPALLTAYIRKNFKNVNAEYMPYNITNFCSDRIILNYIKNSKYDLICFTNYLWNIERNLEIASMIKNRYSEIKVFFGGPEICENSFIFEEYNEVVDFFIKGEGEWFFNKYLFENVDNYITIINKNKIVIQPDNELISENEMVEPYSSNYLNLMPDGSIFMEIIRGCPFKCIYCYYSKNANKIRENKTNILYETIKNENKISEIYILAPTFNRSKNFERILDELILINKKIKLHTEIKAEGITKKIAEKIYKAGFYSLEIGIQTLNINALKKSNRKADIEKEIQGLVNLKNAGIDLKIGIIPGLPEDTVKSFFKTIDILCEYGFDEQIELYPLMILPGTVVREKSDIYNIKYLKKPPYFMIENENFKFNDIVDIKNYLEDRTGIYASFNIKPDFINNDNALLMKGLYIDADKIYDLDEIKISNSIDTNVFSFHINNYKSKISLDNFFQLLSEQKELFNIILYCSEVIDDMEIKRLLEKYQNNDFYRRLHFYDEWIYGNKIMIYQVIEDINFFIEAESTYVYIEPILKVCSANYQQFIFNIKHFEEVPAILIESNIYDEMKEFVAEYYHDYFDKISFSNEKDYRDFCNNTESEYIELPVNFGIAQMN